MKTEETKHGNTRVFKVKYLSPTNYLGSRVKITESRMQKTDTAQMSYNYEIGNVLEQAVKYIKSLGINVLGYGSDNDFYYIFSDSWDYNTDGGYITLK